MFWVKIVTTGGASDLHPKNLNGFKYII